MQKLLSEAPKPTARLLFTEDCLKELVPRSIAILGSPERCLPNMKSLLTPPAPLPAPAPQSPASSARWLTCKLSAGCGDYSAGCILQGHSEYVKFKIEGIGFPAANSHLDNAMWFNTNEGVLN